jgi:hypothetical protein
MSNNPPRKSNKSQKGAAAKKSAAGQRFAERQAAKEQAAHEARRARNRMYGILAVVLAVTVVAVLVIVKVAGGGSGAGSGSGSGVDQASPPAGTPIPAATLATLRSIPLSTLTAAPASGVVTTPQSVDDQALRADGKPELLFIGAEYCPHCAAERWALYVALSKFGSFSPQPGRIHSANEDGDVPTLTFYGTNYTSPYFTFTPVEVYTNKLQGDGYAPLQTPTQAQLTLWQKANGGSFPFLDFGGKQILPSAQYLFTPLESLPFSTVAAQVGNNSTAIGADIDASAAQLVKTICTTLSDEQPSDVCTAVHGG